MPCRILLPYYCTAVTMSSWLLLSHEFKRTQGLPSWHIPFHRWRQLAGAGLQSVHDGPLLSLYHKRISTDPVSIRYISTIHQRQLAGELHAKPSRLCRDDAVRRI